MHKYLLILANLVLLVACSNAIDDARDIYRERLASTLFLPLISEPVLKLWRPDVNVLPRPNANHHIGLLDLARLDGCKLGALIASHNTQLGKLSYPSENFKYQLAFIRLSHACLETHGSSLPAKLKQTLSEATNYKKMHLGDDFTRMLRGEKELASLYTLKPDVLPENNAGFAETVEALSVLAGIATHIKGNTPIELDTSELTRALEVLNRTHYNARLISSVRRMVAFNRSMTRTLEQIQIGERLCPPGKSNPDAKIAHNIFAKYYLGRLQPYQARLGTELRTLLPIYRSLWQLDPTPPNFIAELIGTETTPDLLLQLNESSKHHVLWWQNFYKQCKFSPV